MSFERFNHEFKRKLELFFILRAISDTADMDAGFDFDEFLKSSAKNSADYLIKIVKELNK